MGESLNFIHFPESDPSILRCNQCQYSTKDQKNLEMHVERHKRMDEAKDNLGQVRNTPLLKQIENGEFLGYG